MGFDDVSQPRVPCRKSALAPDRAAASKATSGCVEHGSLTSRRAKVRERCAHRVHGALVLCIVSALTLLAGACAPNDGPCGTPGAVREDGECICSPGLIYVAVSDVCIPTSESNAATSSDSAVSSSRDGAVPRELSSFAAPAPGESPGAPMFGGASSASPPRSSTSTGSGGALDASAPALDGGATPSPGPRDPSAGFGDRSTVPRLDGGNGALRDGGASQHDAGALTASDAGGALEAMPPSRAPACREFERCSAIDGGV